MGLFTAEILQVSYAYITEGYRTFLQQDQLIHLKN